MIIDCFIFFNEFDLLKIRLHELDSWVDRFILIESRETFSGNKKPLYFEENKQMFEKFLPKITHLVSPNTKNPESVWDREKDQRNYIMEGLKDCSDNDLIMIGDVDEITKAGDFSAVPYNNKHHWISVQAQYFFYMNLYRPGGWPGTVFLYYKDIKEHYDNSPHTVRLNRRLGMWLVPKGKSGWHFTFMGGFEAVRFKGRSYSHFIGHMKQSNEFIHQQMKEGGIVKGRPLTKVPIDDSYPKWFVENIEDFNHLLLEEV